LHGARTGARDRQGKDVAFILRAGPTTGILSKHHGVAMLKSPGKC
jgi:hypothetical protein